MFFQRFRQYPALLSLVLCLNGASGAQDFCALASAALTGNPEAIKALQEAIEEKRKSEEGLREMIADSPKLSRVPQLQHPEDAASLHPGDLAVIYGHMDVPTRAAYTTKLLSLFHDARQRNLHGEATLTAKKAQNELTRFFGLAKERESKGRKLDPALDPFAKMYESENPQWALTPAQPANVITRLSMKALSVKNRQQMQEKEIDPYLPWPREDLIARLPHHGLRKLYENISSFAERGFFMDEVSDPNSWNIAGASDWNDMLQVSTDRVKLTLESSQSPGYRKAVLYTAMMIHLAKSGTVSQKQLATAWCDNLLRRGGDRHSDNGALWALDDLYLREVHNKHWGFTLGGVGIFDN